MKIFFSALRAEFCPPWPETLPAPLHAELHGSKPTAQVSLPKTSGLQSKFTRLEPLGLPCLGEMLEAYYKRHSKPKTIAELKEVLQVIWDSLPQGPIDKAVKEFS